MLRRRILWALVSMVGSAALLLHTFLADEGWSKRQRLRSDLEKVEAEIAAGEARSLALRTQLEALRTRPEAQERVVRHELGLVKSDEWVLEVGEAH